MDIFLILRFGQVKKQGMPPGARAGFSMCIHKKRAILFGGVVDTEEKGNYAFFSILCCNMQKYVAKYNDCLRIPILLLICTLLLELMGSPLDLLVRCLD